MRIDQAVNIEDLHRMAKRRLPKIAFDFIEGGLEDERGLETNTSAFHKHQLLPRYLVDVSKRDQTKTMFGHTYASPFGISPTGGAVSSADGADLMLAEAAADANIPYIMSGASNDSIEAAAKIAPKNAWYQLYAARDPAVNADLIRRTADAGLGALVLTVDTPVGSKRERNIRNGFANIRGGLFQAFSLKPSILAEALTHPGWIVEYLRRGGGTPMLENWQPYAPAGSNAEAVYKHSGSFASVQRPDLARPRELPRAVPAQSRRKGHHGSARCVAWRRDRLRRHHRIESWRPPARSGAGVARRPAGDQAAVGDKLTVMLDSGVRRGADILIALCLGARFLLHGPADALWRRRGRDPGREKGDHDFPRRDRSRDGRRSAARASTSSARISCGARIARGMCDFFPPRTTLTYPARAGWVLPLPQCVALRERGFELSFL